MTTWWYCLSVMILIECNDIDWAWWLTWLIDNCTVKTTEWTVLTQRFLDVGVCPKHLHSLQACSPVNYDAFEKQCCLCSSWYQWMLKHIRQWFPLMEMCRVLMYFHSKTAYAHADNWNGIYKTLSLSLDENCNGRSCLSVPVDAVVSWIWRPVDGLGCQSFVFAFVDPAYPSSTWFVVIFKWKRS